MKVIALILIGCLLYAGCTTTHLITQNEQDYKKLNQAISGETIQAKFIDAEVVITENMRVEMDSCFWTESGDAYLNIVPTDELIVVTKKDRARGAFDGLKIGLGAILVSAMLGFFAGDDEEGLLKFSREEKATLMALVLGLPSTVICVAAGAIMGHTEKFYLTYAYGGQQANQNPDTKKDEIEELADGRFRVRVSSVSTENGHISIDYHEQNIKIRGSFVIQQEHIDNKYLIIIPGDVFNKYFL